MAKKKTVKKKAVASKAPKVNKSDLIRAAVDANPEAGASLIVAELASKGIAVSPQMAATVKSRYLSKGGKVGGGKRKKRGPNKNKLAGTGAHNGRAVDSVAAIQGAALLLRSAGGLAEATAILKAMSTVEVRNG